jgi:hypothetical protein
MMRTLLGVVCIVALPVYYGGAVPLLAVLFGLVAGMLIENVVRRRER